MGSMHIAVTAPECFCCMCVGSQALCGRLLLNLVPRVPWMSFSTGLSLITRLSTCHSCHAACKQCPEPIASVPSSPALASWKGQMSGSLLHSCLPILGPVFLSGLLQIPFYISFPIVKGPLSQHPSCICLPLDMRSFREKGFKCWAELLGQHEVWLYLTCETLHVEGLKEMCLEWRGCCPGLTTDRFEDISALTCRVPSGEMGSPET